MAKEIEQIEHLSKHYKNNYEPDVDAGWAKLHARMQAAKATDNQKLIVAARRRWLSAAAAILLVAVASVWILQSADKQLVVETRADEQRNIALPDGSAIVLNGNSKLVYPQNFDKSKKRSVQLSGEAFFQVQPNADKPFVISTDQTNITVLGTSFNVRAYEQELTTEVEVATGKVAFAVKNSDASITLNPGQTGIYDVTASKLFYKSTAQLNAQAWFTHRLNFESASLSEVFQALERYYKIKFDIANPAINRCGYTSNFENSELAEVLASLSLGLRLKVEKIAPNRYLIAGKGCD
ncbi:MAG: FecR domain-containing protein [Saprospiraceae bacterium]|nr:FecR domain-containing protein [Saprospiraceae bacterium]